MSKEPIRALVAIPMPGTAHIGRECAVHLPRIPVRKGPYLKGD